MVGWLTTSYRADNGAWALNNLVVVSQGYVGLPLVMRAVEVGHRVVGYDLDRGPT